MNARTATDPAPATTVEEVDLGADVAVGVAKGALDSAVIKPPNPERGGGVPVAISSVVRVLSVNISVRISRFDVLMAGSEAVLLLLFGTLDIIAPTDAVNNTVGVDSKVDVGTSVVEALVVVVGLEMVISGLDIMADVRVGVVLLLLCALFQVARRHCFISVLSTRRPF